MPPQPVDQKLAVLRIRTWVRDRQQLKTGRPPARLQKYHGATQRRASQYDARIVRVIDFERIFQLLDDRHQRVLLMRHRQEATVEETAHALYLSPRTIHTLERDGLSKLAEMLDAADLL